MRETPHARAKLAGKFASFSPHIFLDNGERRGHKAVRHRYQVAAIAKSAVGALDAAALRFARARCGGEDRSLQRHVMLFDEQACHRCAALQRSIDRTAAAGNQRRRFLKDREQIEARLGVERVAK